MAAITASNVTIIDSWEVVSLGGKTILHRVVDIVISSNGGTANDIPASLLGFRSILAAHSIRHTASGPAYHCVPVIVEADSEGILTINLEQSTDNQRSDPSNPHVNGTLRVLVIGDRS
jgi:hypothetical protein